MIGRFGALAVSALLAGCGGAADGGPPPHDARSPAEAQVTAAVGTFVKPAPGRYPSNFCGVLVLVRNPSLSHSIRSLKAQVADSEKFCRGALATIGGKGIRGQDTTRLRISPPRVMGRYAQVSVSYRVRGSRKTEDLERAEVSAGKWRVVTAVGT